MAESSFVMDYKVILVLVAFVSALVFFQTQFNTSYLTNSITNQYYVYWNGTAYTNITSGSQLGTIPTPPVCTWGVIYIDGIVGCVFGNVGYYWDLLTFRTEIAWFNILILIPIVIVFGYLIINLIIRLGTLLKPLG